MSRRSAERREKPSHDDAERQLNRFFRRQQRCRSGDVIALAGGTSRACQAAYDEFRHGLLKRRLLQTNVVGELDQGRRFQTNVAPALTDVGHFHPHAV